MAAIGVFNASFIRSSPGRTSSGHFFVAFYSIQRQVILDAKNEEFINVFTESMPDEKNRVVQILKEIDPANISKYQRITQ